MCAHREGFCCLALCPPLYFVSITTYIRNMIVMITTYRSILTNFRIQLINNNIYQEIIIIHALTHRWQPR